MDTPTLNLGRLTTEARNDRSMMLDTMSALEIVSLMNREDALIPEAIRPHLPKIAQAADQARDALRAGGRIFYLGAGTSGRLGVLDASECPPTFGVPAGCVVGLIAGGEQAFTRAVEGAEDDPSLAEADLRAYHLTDRDFVIGLAASGRTPYVLGGLAYARQTGCHTASVSCNKNTDLGRAAEIGIEVETGPEVLTGSTRLKAGTAQKMILNMISTAAMVRVGKAYQNLMVDVVPTNEKLRGRALRIVTEATGADEQTARLALEEADGRCKTAIVMILSECSAAQAQERLRLSQGHARAALSLQVPDAASEDRP